MSVSTGQGFTPGGLVAPAKQALMGNDGPEFIISQKTGLPGRKKKRFAS